MLRRRDFIALGGSAALLLAGQGEARGVARFFNAHMARWTHFECQAIERALDRSREEKKSSQRSVVAPRRLCEESRVGDHPRCHRT